MFRVSRDGRLVGRPQARSCCAPIWHTQIAASRRRRIESTFHPNATPPGMFARAGNCEGYPSGGRTSLRSVPSPAGRVRLRRVAPRHKDNRGGVSRAGSQGDVHVSRPLRPRLAREGRLGRRRVAGHDRCVHVYASACVFSWHRPRNPADERKPVSRERVKKRRTLSNQDSVRSGVCACVIGSWYPS